MCSHNFLNIHIYLNMVLICLKTFHHWLLLWKLAVLNFFRKVLNKCLFFRGLKMNNMTKIECRNCSNISLENTESILSHFCSPTLEEIIYLHDLIASTPCNHHCVPATLSLVDLCFHRPILCIHISPCNAAVEGVGSRRRCDEPDQACLAGRPAVDR